MCLSFSAPCWQMIGSKDVGRSAVAALAVSAAAGTQLSLFLSSPSSSASYRTRWRARARAATRLWRWSVLAARSLPSESPAAAGALAAKENTRWLQKETELLRQEEENGMSSTTSAKMMSGGISGSSSVSAAGSGLGLAGLELAGGRWEALAAFSRSRLAELCEAAAPVP